MNPLTHRHSITYLSESLCESSGGLAIVARWCYDPPMETGRLKDIDAALDFAIEREQDAQQTYRSYAKATQRSGFRELLLSMVDQEAEHEKRLRELKQTQIFAAKPSASTDFDMKISEFTVDVAFSPQMNYQDFLILVMKREEKAVHLYEWLQTVSQDSDLSVLFERLAEEERKHKAWAQDRYDLEILTEN